MSRSLATTPAERRRSDAALFAKFCALRRAIASGSPQARQVEYYRLRDELVVKHLSLVRYLAAKFSNRGEALDDLIQVGALGLLKAIDRFDDERGVEFATYATPTIVGEIKRYFRDKGWAVRVPRRLQELNLAVNRASERLTVERGRAPTVGDLAEELRSSPEEILEAQELGGAYNLISLDSEVSGDGEKRAQTLGETLASGETGLEFFEEKANLERAVAVLGRRERMILFLRFYDGLSQSEIAKRLGLSQMHISRLLQRALDRLKDELGEDARPGGPAEV